MEGLSIQRFLSIGSGYGVGSCDGSGAVSGWGSGGGWGSGSNDGWGSGAGWGSVNGSGYGSDYGFGDSLGAAGGYGSSSFAAGDIKSYNGRAVHQIDGIQTLIDVVFGDCAKGAILRKDLSLEPCFIAKREGCFAHGETLREAVAAATEKAFELLPEEGRIDAFLEAHVHGVKYPHRDFYDWHHRLTGSCELGRKEFARAHGLDIDTGEMTVDEFLELTENAFGAATIRKLKERWDERETEAG